MNVRLNYILLQLINAAFFLLSYLFVENRLSETKGAGEFLILLPVVLGGVWVFYTNRLFYMLIKHGYSDES